MVIDIRLAAAAVELKFCEEKRSFDKRSALVHWPKECFFLVPRKLECPGKEVTTPDLSRRGWAALGEWGRGPQMWDQRSITWSPKSENTADISISNFSGILRGYGYSYGVGEGIHTEKCQKSVDISLQVYLTSNLKQLLVACARSLSANILDDFVILIETARSFVSIAGEPYQHLGGYMVEGLVASKKVSCHNIYEA